MTMFSATAKTASIVVCAHIYMGLLIIAAYLTVSTTTGFVYAVPTSPLLNVCAEYNRTTRNLQTIESTWNETVCKEQSLTLYFRFCCLLEFMPAERVGQGIVGVFQC